MSRIKHFLAGVMALLTVVMLMPAAAFAAENSADGRVIVYANVPADWASPCVWAWADDGTNAFDAWPGGEMEADAANEGWYYCWIPEATNNIIINANAGGVQTSDYKLDGKNAWVTVTDAETVTIEYEAQTTGDLPEYVETFKIHAQVPDSWESVGLWAWSAPDGTNAFTSWPGEALEDNGDGWLSITVPGWINSVIVNGNEGSVQTTDLSVETGKDIWVVVTDAENAEVSYEEPAVAAVEESAETTEAVEVEETVPETAEAEEAAPETTTQSSSTPIVVGVVAAVAVLGGGGYYISKKRKNG